MKQYSCGLGRSHAAWRAFALMLVVPAASSMATVHPKMILKMVPPPTKLSESFESKVRNADLVEALRGGLDALTTASLRIEDEMELSVGNNVSSQVIANKPLTREAIRMWMQSYNAGPYALLKYKGNVPYRETQNYAPRVFKYYQMDLSKSSYEPYIQAAAQKWGMDPQLIRAIIKTESDFNNKTVSHAGARGLMQVMPCVWEEMQKRYGKDEYGEYLKGVFDPAQNIDAACGYLAWLRYDFLPRHFAEFEPNPVKPLAYVSDGYKAKLDDRIVVASAAAPATVSKSSAKPTPTTSAVKITMRDSSGRTTVISSAEANKLLSGTKYADAIDKARVSGQRIRVRIKRGATGSLASAELENAVANAKSAKDTSKAVAQRKTSAKSKPKS